MSVISMRSFIRTAVWMEYYNDQTLLPAFGKRLCITWVIATIVIAVIETFAAENKWQIFLGSCLAETVIFLFAGGQIIFLRAAQSTLFTLWLIILGAMCGLMPSAWLHAGNNYTATILTATPAVSWPILAWLCKRDVGELSTEKYYQRIAASLIFSVAFSILPCAALIATWVHRTTLQKYDLWIFSFDTCATGVTAIVLLILVRRCGLYARRMHTIRSRWEP